MPNKKSIALIALLEHNTVSDAAEASSVSKATMFRYLQDPAFRAKFQKAKQDIVDQALSRLQKACANAVDVLVEIMNDRETASGIRVRAADCILSRAIDTTKIESLETRISELEEGMIQ